MAKLTAAQRRKLQFFGRLPFSGVLIRAPLRSCSLSFRRLVARRMIARAAVQDGVPVYRITTAGRAALERDNG